MDEYQLAKKTCDVTVGESVKIIRELQGLNQNELADLTGIPQSTLSAIEHVRIPSVVYSIQENTVDEHTQTHSLNIIGSPGNLAALSNSVVEGSSAGRTLPRQPPNDL
ncbi:MAG: helix-turn-helix transcriptional regulator [Nitrosomonas sp.]|nr:helix-turn-helix transcriptional regulator [Nitrosomonas sp.]